MSSESVGKVIHLDVDGVLADFAKAACETHKREWDGKTWDMAKLWGMSARDFWQPLDADWFRNLPVTPEADEIVRIVEQHEFLFVTSPPADFRVYTAKAAWLGSRWPKHKRRICICAKKELIGGGLLIDDSADNCARYRGQTIHWPVSLEELERRVQEYLR